MMTPDPAPASYDPALILAGDRRALARLLTHVEAGRGPAEAALAALFPHTGRAHLVGVTGAPGTGKSSLVNALARVLRGQGRTVAIVAVDPTSPFTGGAILGDRIRMRDLAGDPGVFIRSMATRGALGGLARTTADVVQVLDAAGFDVVLIETVGAGQSEVEIARTAHTTVVVEAPGLGDDVQGLKAGILEIADVLVVNKCDQPGAEAAVRTLRAALDLGRAAGRRADPGAPEAWSPPLLQTVAVQGTGVAELAEALARHRDYLQSSGAQRRFERARLAQALEARLRDALFAGWLAGDVDGQLDRMVDKLLRREIDPSRAVQSLLAAPSRAATLAREERHP
jgi:LAO/AO transport system kinase